MVSVASDRNVENPDNLTPAEPLLASAMSFLRRFPPFDDMEDGLLRTIAGQLSLSYHPKSSTILSPRAGVPSSLFIVQRGLVQLRPAEGYHVSDSEVLTLGPGECFSVYALMEKRAVGSPYTAAADTFCYQLPAAVFRELLHRSRRFQEFSTDYLRSLLQDSRRLIRMHSAGAAVEQQAMHRSLRELAKSKPVACGADTALATALRQMHEARVGSIVIVDGSEHPIGILTRHDVLDRVTLSQRPLTDAIRTVMTADPVTLPADANVYEAALLIAARGIRHVPLTEEGRLVGVVTERDLFALQRTSVRGIHRVIAQADDADALEQAGHDIHTLTRALHAQGVSAEQLTHLITTLNDALTRRVIAVVQRTHDLAGIRWCWLAFGSEGRQEQTVSTTDGQIDASDARARMLPFAAEVNQLLDRCGFPLCKGGIMAGNPRWCLSAQEWRGQFSDWMNNTDPQALLNSVIFFDLRPLAGDMTLAGALEQFLTDHAAANPRFLRQLAQYALETRPPLGIISEFLTEDDENGQAFIDLKKSASRLFVDAARVLALAAGVACANTAQRLRESGQALKMDEKDVAAAIDAFYFIQQLRLRGQLSTQLSTHPSTQMSGGATAHAFANRVFPATLNEIDRRILKESLRQVRKLQGRLALDYQL
jgi:CBS domain-containing protein